MSPVGLSHRGRDDVERRFQNPSQQMPIVPLPGRRLVLAGLWQHDPAAGVGHPVVVIADADRRVDRRTRWSVFVPLTTLVEAQETGWSESVSDSGELIRCITPALMSVAVTANADASVLDGGLIRIAAAAAGLLEEPHGNGPAARRARRTTSTLVRDAPSERKQSSLDTVPRPRRPPSRVGERPRFVGNEWSARGGHGGLACGVQRFG